MSDLPPYPSVPPTPPPGRPEQAGPPTPPAGGSAQLGVPGPQPSAPLQQAPRQPSPAPAPAPAKRNGLGVAALILGIVAFVGAFIPLFNYLALLIALAAVIVGVIAAISGRGRGLGVAGSIIGFVALLAAIVMAVVYTFVFFGSLVSTALYDSGLTYDTVPLVYEVDGTGTDVDITYTVSIGGALTTQQALAQDLPFENSLDVPFGGADSYASYTLTAVNGADGGDVTCRVTLDGEVIAEETASGAYATASCTGSAAELLSR
ncbi:hypothetical protein SCB71_07690 [Herbiconiux sp. KACC 21604]|uniref:hypothetical protein n=1 Tax=unclassified Herbiconiux TaxID=2618217 RepID=UPI0014931793|nr:hypothetical protein [Herbiconiux sp. SALV-R1]QJU53163.1 hypothetical protein HL652_05660 [Herbiconiux sp. SALV-R1]WPO88108.1 hypothetical protein SCB71_07690 [Herbiconiux sp. KACC 21604]